MAWYEELECPYCGHKHLIGNYDFECENEIDIECENEDCIMNVKNVVKKIEMIICLE